MTTVCHAIDNLLSLQWKLAVTPVTTCCHINDNLLLATWASKSSLPDLYNRRSERLLLKQLVLKQSKQHSFKEKWTSFEAKRTCFEAKLIWRDIQISAIVYLCTVYSRMVSWAELPVALAELGTPYSEVEVFMDQFFTIWSNPIHERSIHIHIHEASTISIHIQSSSISTIF